MTRRRWIADEWSRESSSAALTGEQANHLARVLRAEPGQVFDVVAGGFLHRASVNAVSPGRVGFELHEELEADSALPLHLYLAIFKFDHLEWAIEKATELGVSAITPVLARRTEKHLALAAEKRVTRWRRIALEASQQSRRTDIPTIADPTPLKSALAADTATLKILLSETEQTTTLSSVLSTTAGVPHPLQSHRNPGSPDDALGRPGWGGWEEHSSLAVAIGPEGGWTPEEMSLFTTHNWTPVTLGPRILRAETAAIAAIAIVGTTYQ